MAQTLELYSGRTSRRKDYNPAEAMERFLAMNELGTLDPANMKYDKSGVYTTYVQGGDVTFTIHGNVIDGIGQIVKFTADGTNNVTFSSDFESTALYNVTSGSPLTAGDYWFYMLSVNRKIHVNVKGAT
ncbi:MAG: hypothetical protein ACXABY_07080 [Candidatus Thorarchaeota archaeon]|jgi:hypothetical protein